MVKRIPNKILFGDLDLSPIEPTMRDAKKDDHILIRIPVKLKNELNSAALNANMAATELVRKLIEDYINANKR
jgi:hypothetical protein